MEYIKLNKEEFKLIRRCLDDVYFTCKFCKQDLYHNSFMLISKEISYCKNIQCHIEYMKLKGELN